MRQSARLIYDHIPESFIINQPSFDEKSFSAQFHYAYQDQDEFCEKIYFTSPTHPLSEQQKIALKKALYLAAVLIGTSYFKVHPTPYIWTKFRIDDFQKGMFNYVYQEGLSQFAYENHLTRSELGDFSSSYEFSQMNNDSNQQMPSIGTKPQEYTGQGVLALQSGGKDSLLTATLLNKKQIPWTALYISSNTNYPKVLDLIGAKSIQVVTRLIDHTNLTHAAKKKGLNGHVPVTYINMAIALIQAIINSDNQILTSIGHEGEELHAIIKSRTDDSADLPVNHQWSKTWHAERMFSDYIKHYITPNLVIGSSLRRYSELKISQLFAEKCWHKYKHYFSSCNQANYKQGNNNSYLSWCGECAKCANSYLLFAPFLESDDLNSLFPNQVSLFTKPNLTPIFKGLLGIDHELKPFECVGEIEELRRAYHLKKSDYPDLPFEVPESNYDYEQHFPSANLKI